VKRKRKYVKRGIALIKDVRTAELAMRVEQLERRNLLLRIALFLEQAKVERWRWNRSAA
jgi:hypothetical protein